MKTWIGNVNQSVADQAVVDLTMQNNTRFSKGPAVNGSPQEVGIYREEKERVS